MARLFVAIELPDQVKSELERVQPRPTAGLRIVTPNQMHLTLHFIGEADVDQTIAALTPVKNRQFALQLEGLGRFPPRGRANVLWAGVIENEELNKLYATVGTALGQIGFQPESSPYAPHITLARCAYKVNPNIADDFLERSHELVIPPIAVDGFTLFSSTIEADGPVYHREHWFAI
jgi:2'-5' RNA ligase